MMFVLRSHQLDGEAMPQSGPDLPSGKAEVTSHTQHHPVVREVFARRSWLAEAGSGRNGEVARMPAVQASRWTGMSMLPPFAATFAVRFGGAKAASECPKHIADTQALIDRVSDRMARDEGRMHHDVAGLVHALLDDARMLLAAARRNHEQPQGPFDHARAFAKTDAALGHARAAENLHSRSTQQRG